MAGEVLARLALLLCIFGTTIPVLMAGIPEGDLRPNLLGLGCVLAPAATPLVGLGISAWAWRRNAAASARLAVAAVLGVAIGWVGWWAGAQDPKGIEMTGSMVLVPFGQAVIWATARELARDAVTPDDFVTEDE